VRAGIVVLALASLGMQERAPEGYGRVVFADRARQAGVPPVGFDHFRHRTRFTCRVCHVDVGFAMAAGGSEITADTNRKGFHCGACHDGKKQYRGRTVFKACSGVPTLTPGCEKCHVSDDYASRRAEYERLAARLPRAPGGTIDWDAAEARGDIRPLSSFEGVSIARPAMKNDREAKVSVEVSWVGDVIFSHKKHAAWNGCEVCHPEIFPAVKRGARSSMLEINAGASCGACHVSVAFSIQQCERCHASRRGGP
jgi:c(7)-type cytochrome triheme protein